MGDTTYSNLAYSEEGALLKKSRTGLELEMHVLDVEGRISHRALELIEAVKRKHPEVEIVKECGLNIIEFGCQPDETVRVPALELLESVEKTIAVAKEMGLMLYPFGTYPGRVEARFTPSDRYVIQEKIFGREKFSQAVKVVGFHLHHILPKGVFDAKKKDLRFMMNSKFKRSLLSCYNFEIAIEPLVSLFTQSSPFVDETYLAKDSRALVYFGGGKLHYPQGLFSNHQQFGGLPPYKQTGTDLMSSLNSRRQRWKKLILEADPTADPEKLYPYGLDISWNPVKINKHGTLELRGMDANYLSLLIAVSVLIKFCLKAIQRQFIEVLPSDLALVKPFHFENGMLHVPPHTHVRKKLQYYSAYEGYENEELYEYAKRFLVFAEPLVNPGYEPFVAIIKEQLERRQSTADEMIKYAQKQGYWDGRKKKGKKILAADAAAFALHYITLFEEDLAKTKSLLLLLDTQQA